MVQLDVDSEVNHVVGPLNPKPVDHREPVFVGGVPGKRCSTGTSLQILITIAMNRATWFHNSPDNPKDFL